MDHLSALFHHIEKTTLGAQFEGLDSQSALRQRLERPAARGASELAELVAESP